MLVAVGVGVGDPTPGSADRRGHRLSDHAAAAIAYRSVGNVERGKADRVVQAVAGLKVTDYEIIISASVATRRCYSGDSPPGDGEEGDEPDPGLIMPRVRCAVIRMCLRYVCYLKLELTNCSGK